MTLLSRDARRGYHGVPSVPAGEPTRHTRQSEFAATGVMTDSSTGVVDCVVADHGAISNTSLEVKKQEGTLPIGLRGLRFV